jgi:plastocyanin
MNRTISVKSFILVLAAILLFTACSSSGAQTQASNGASANEHIAIQGIAVEPQKLQIPVGTTVTWTNKDPVKHTVTSGGPGKDAVPGISKGTPPKLTGVFDRPMSPSGSTFSFAFKKAGTYPYFCRIHPSLRGIIVVR